MVQIGVYGLGGISRRVIQGVLFSRNANLYAVCSSSIEKADAFKDIFVHRIICMPNIFSWHWQIINM